jgi:hypothetical protein
VPPQGSRSGRSTRIAPRWSGSDTRSRPCGRTSSLGAVVKAPRPGHMGAPPVAKGSRRAAAMALPAPSVARFGCDADLWGFPGRQRTAAKGQERRHDPPLGRRVDGRLVSEPAGRSRRTSGYTEALARNGSSLREALESRRTSVEADHPPRRPRAGEIRALGLHHRSTASQRRAPQTLWNMSRRPQVVRAWPFEVAHIRGHLGAAAHSMCLGCRVCDQPLMSVERVLCCCGNGCCLPPVSALSGE